MRKTNKSALQFINEVAGKSRLYILFLLLVQMVLGISSVFYALLLRGLIDSFEQSLSADELDMLRYYLSSGVYGTFDRMVANRMEKQKQADGKKKLSKLSYYWHRVFPGMELYENYPLLVKHKWLIPAYWFYRIVRMLFSRKRRDYMLREVKVVKRVVAKEY